MKYLAAGAGLLLMLLGVVTLFSPIPIGVVLLASGLSILVYVSPRTQNILRNVRGKNQKINHFLFAIEEKIETKLVKLHVELIKTRPQLEKDRDVLG